MEFVINSLRKDLIKLIHCLEIYLEYCVGKVNVKYISPDIKDIEFDKILSFNYTTTYEKIYTTNNDKIEYHYIHGKADITNNKFININSRSAINNNLDKNNMVLGIDEYLDDEAKNKTLEFIAFKKYFQRIYKKTGNTYKKWIEQMEEIHREKCESEKNYRERLTKTMNVAERNNILSSIENINKNNNEVYIFGHSLDVTDKDIIKELIECPDTVTKIFYYDKDVYAQQIANLVKIIGQDELIKRVSAANPTIIFKEQQKRIERN